MNYNTPPPRNSKIFLRNVALNFCPSGNITRDKRFGTRLVPHPNFAPFHSAKLLLSRYVKRNFGQQII